MGAQRNDALILICGVFRAFHNLYLSKFYSNIGSRFKPIYSLVIGEENSHSHVDSSQYMNIYDITFLC